MINIFLDDERFPEDVTWIELPSVEWTIVRTQEEFQQLIIATGLQNVNHISYDNDLGEGMREGIFCAQWLVDEILDGRLDWNPAFRYTVHSKNNIAAERIRGLLDPFIKFMEG
jgi:hypothetical protein